MAGFWRLAQVVTGANPTATASPSPKTIMFLNPFRKTDFSETLSIVDLLFDKFCVCYKAVLLSILTRSVPKDLSQQKQLVIQKWINPGFDNQRNGSTILSRNVCLFPRKTEGVHRFGVQKFNVTFQRCVRHDHTTSEPVNLRTCEWLLLFFYLTTLLARYILLK